MESAATSNRNQKAKNPNLPGLDDRAFPLTGSSATDIAVMVA
jgi:hypothetical protein